MNCRPRPPTLVAEHATSKQKETPIMHKAVITLNTGLEDAETVTVAFLVAVGAAEQGRQTLIFLTKEAVRLATEGFARAVACDGCPPLADLVQRYEKAGGRFLVPDLHAGPQRRPVRIRDQRRGRRHRAHVGVDRRRPSGDIQLLIAPAAAKGAP